VRAKFAVRASAPIRRVRYAQAALGVAGLATVLTGMIGTGGPAAADGNCENVTQYSAVAAASGARSTVAAPNLTLGGVADEGSPADASLPGSQSQIDSVQGSKGWGGAPYSATVADNAGAGGVDSGQVPVFAVAQNPASPKSSKAIPGGSLDATASSDSATGKAAVGASNTSGAGVGSVVTDTKSTCASDTTLEALADTTATGVDIAGVLKIASVHSHARAAVSPSGDKQLDGTVEINGATVGGQPVSITDKGVVLAGNPTPLAADPVTPALQAAGITVRYIAAVKDDGQGQMLAPTIEISIAKTVPGPNGDVPGHVTLSFGRAFARASLQGSDASLFGSQSSDMPLDELTSAAADPGTTSDVGVADAAPVDTPAADVATTPTAAPRTAGAANVATARIADWSIAPGYSAMGVGALLLLAAWLGLERIAVRLRWR
jgi:hypothetical protein